MDGVPILVSPSLTRISNTNDNYCVGPTHIQVNQCRLDLPNIQTVQNLVKLGPRTFSIQKLSKKTLKSDVSCHAVSHAHIVLLYRLPQRKGLSPV